MAAASQGPLPKGLVAVGAVLLCIGSYWGLAQAPGEIFMGDVQRIMYVHVPTAWNAMLALTFAFVCAVFFLFTNSWKWDNRLEAAMEMGVVLSLLLCTQGAIWAKPTWGVWWDWDPRLTTTAVMVFAFGGILALRAFVDDPMKRAVWSAVACIVAFADVPIVYFSVKWWNSLHQAQSTPATVSKAFHWPLRINAFGILFLWAGLVALRTRVAALRLRSEIAPPLPAPSARGTDARASGSAW
ncbi:MAG TPA: cytochrome c biogenesis protein CcsA [Candidatus Limnocylindrales bacterium]|jgi:heme exporter protein C|nr:cytochrome c biogenesis protein CcsA [Myxococcales bacterium]HLQ67284.1 cytochrome c biogenesis protein CcsA [Candidatus Limnocylindrales bacterium]